MSDERDALNREVQNLNDKFERAVKNANEQAAELKEEIENLQLTIKEHQAQVEEKEQSTC